MWHFQSFYERDLSQTNRERTSEKSWGNKIKSHIWRKKWNFFSAEKNWITISEMNTQKSVHLMPHIEEKRIYSINLETKWSFSTNLVKKINSHSKEKPIPSLYRPVSTFFFSPFFMKYPFIYLFRYMVWKVDVNIIFIMFAAYKNVCDKTISIWCCCWRFYESIGLNGVCVNIHQKIATQKEFITAIFLSFLID